MHFSFSLPFRPLLSPLSSPSSLFLSLSFLPCTGSLGLSPSEITISNVRTYTLMHLSITVLTLYYLRQGSCVFASVCLFICLFVITTITGKVVDRFWQKFLYGWDVWLYRKTELDFRYDPDHDTGIFTGILTIAGWDNSTNFADNSRICRRNSYDFFKDRMSHWQQIIGAETGGREDNVPNNLVGVRHSECPLSQYFARLSCISVH